MFKLAQVFQRAPKPVEPVQNTFQSFAVAMPAELMPVLQKRIFGVILHRYYGVKQLPELTISELIDLEAFLTSYCDPEEHFMLMDGRHLSLLRRFLTAERVHLSQSRLAVTVIPNEQYWSLVGDLLLSTIRPVQLVKLSFWG